jgi:hypothetical protein
LVPLGTLTLTAAGTTVSLAVNCGPLAGQVITQNAPLPLPGTPLRQVILTNATAATNAFLLPRGMTAAGNPASILACIPGGATLAIPYGQPFEGGILPENFVLDCSAACVVYGCGILS